MHAHCWQNSLCAEAEVRASGPGFNQKPGHPERWKMKMDYAPAENDISVRGRKSAFILIFLSRHPNSSSLQPTLYQVTTTAPRQTNQPSINVLLMLDARNRT
jgi:hypothetical protein